MTPLQRRLTVIAVALILAIGLVLAIVATHSRIGSLPPDCPPLPCGHAVLTSTQSMGVTKAVCLRGEVWFHHRGGWTNNPPLEPALPQSPAK